MATNRVCLVNFFSQEHLCDDTQKVTVVALQINDLVTWKVFEVLVDVGAVSFVFFFDIHN